jgi:hypothetical protein
LGATNYRTAITFIFLCKLCEKVDRIKFVKELLSPQNLHSNYPNFPLEGLVHFMYKWALSQNNSFVSNEKYIR